MLFFFTFSFSTSVFFLFLKGSNSNVTGPISLGESLQSIKQSNGRVYELYKNLEGFASLVFQRTQHDPRVPGLGVHARRSIKPAWFQLCVSLCVSLCFVHSNIHNSDNLATDRQQHIRNPALLFPSFLIDFFFPCPFPFFFFFFFFFFLIWYNLNSA